MTAAEWGRQLAAARRALGWTQESMAERVGVSRQAVAKWERGAALPGPGNLLALRQCLGDALPEPPGPAGEEHTAGEAAGETAALNGTGETAKAEPRPAAKPAAPNDAGEAGNAAAPAEGVSPEPAAPKGTGKGRKNHPWLAALAVLCVVFCLLSLVTYVFTAVAGAYLLLVTVAAVAAWAVVCKVRGQSAAPALWGGLKAVGVQLTALAVAAVFAYFIWLAGAGYRVDALVPLTRREAYSAPALSVDMRKHEEDEGPYALCYSGGAPVDGYAQRYLLVLKGVTGEPEVSYESKNFNIRLTWQPGDPDEMQYYLVQCSGKRSFHLVVGVEGGEDRIDVMMTSGDHSIYERWLADLEELWQTYG